MNTLLEFYNKAQRRGRLPNGQGLCFEESLRFDLFSVVIDDKTYSMTKLFKPKRLPVHGFWGVEGRKEKPYHIRKGALTDLRKNVILLMCAMRDELK